MADTPGTDCLTLDAYISLRNFRIGSRLGLSTMSGTGPLLLRKQTSAGHHGMSRNDPKETCAFGLFDHLVGALLKMQRHVEAELLGGLEIDHQLELDRGLNGKLARLRALEDAIGIGRRAPKIVGLVSSVGQQAAEFSEETDRIDGREPIASRQRNDLYAMDIRKATRHHDKATIRLACLCGNDRFDLGPVANRCCDRLHCERGSGNFE